MPRFLSPNRLTGLLLGTLIGFAAPTAHAAAPNPLDLVQGLREQGMADLALDYLTVIESRSPSAELKILLPLERAKTRLIFAESESDEGTRDGLIAEAKRDFDTFLKDHPKHPRAPEASLALAKVVSLQAKALLSKARRMDPEKQAERKTAAAATRPLFLKAAQLYGTAARQIQGIIDAGTTDPLRKRALERESLQAELDKAINQFNIVDTYISPQGKEAAERGDALIGAKKLFTDLSKRDPNNPICWVARAYIGACDIELTAKKDAEDAFKALKADATRNPAGADGVRMVEFFEAQQKYQEAETAPQINSAKAVVRQWLDRDKYRQRMTPQRLSMTYYSAQLAMDEALKSGGIVFEKAPAGSDKPPKIVSVSGVARAALLEANREFKKLLEFDNDYTDRAGMRRSQAIRILAGNAEKPPAQQTIFEECQMTALVKLDNATKLDGDQRLAGMQAAAALLERARVLATPETPPKDLAEIESYLAYAYLNGDRPYSASVLAESLARTQRGSTAARAGLISVESYLTSRSKLNENDTDARNADRQRALKLGMYLDTTFPNDPSTDAVRYRIGRLFLEEQQYQEAFDALGRVNSGYIGAVGARQMQGRAAFMLLVDKESKLTPQQKAAIFRKTIADIEAIPEPAGGNELKLWFSLRNLLANIHLLNPPEGYGRAELVAMASLKHSAEVAMTEPEKKEIAFGADNMRLRAVYAQYAPLMKDGKFKELGDKLNPYLAEMKKNGPAKAANLEGEGAITADSLDKFRQRVVVLALQARIREGAFDQATELFELLESLGGSVESTSEALGQLVGLVKPQLEELRAASKDEEATKLAEVVGSLVRKQAEKPNLSPRVLVSLGRSLRDLAVYDKAIEILEKVPLADTADLMVRRADLPLEKQDGVIVHQIAQIELSRAYRATKQFDKSDAILKTALGTKEKPGWAKSLEFEREAVFLLEDKAAESPGDQSAKFTAWGEARKGWNTIAGKYAAALRAKIDPKLTEDQKQRKIQDKEKLIPVYLELLADEKRCLARANTQLLAGKPQLADALGKLAKQMIEIETSNPKGITVDVREKFFAILTDYPLMKDAYIAQGGKLFLAPAEAAPLDPSAAP